MALVRFRKYDGGAHRVNLRAVTDFGAREHRDELEPKWLKMTGTCYVKRHVFFT